VSAAADDIAAAVRAWLHGLDDAQRAEATFPFDSDERFVWAYTPGTREGLAIRDMRPHQREAAQAILRAAGRDPAELEGQLDLVALATIADVVPLVDENRALAAAGLAATKVEDAGLARFLEGESRLVRLGGGFAVSAPAYETARDLVVRECAAAGEITLSRFRDLAAVGRRDAQLLLERMDVDGLTRRVGDRRVLRRAARTDA